MMSETVIREVVKNIWTFSCPFARFGFFPFGGRSTAIKLKSGGVWMLASTPLEPETKAKIDELGPVKYIVSPDAVHFLFLSEFKKAYPEATLIAPVEVVDRLKDLKFDGGEIVDRDAISRTSLIDSTKLGAETLPTHYMVSKTRHGHFATLTVRMADPLDRQIKTCFFSGFKNKDIAFLHVESKVLIEADLLFNLPAKEQYSKSSSSPNLPFISTLSPTSWFHPRMIRSLGVDQEAMKHDARTVASWDFEKIVPCHGDVIEADGKKVWESVYKFYLKD